MANSNCIFCSIITQNGDNVLYQDEDIFVILDINPVSKFHYLIIPRTHIADAKHLTINDKPLLEKMMTKAKAVLEENNVDMNDTRLAFHWPPFHSVSHLHLHAIAPASQMSFVNKLSFKINTWWCVTPEYVMERISKSNL